MALVIEDGTNIAGATSFATADQIAAYALARGVTLAPANLDVYAIKAMDYLASLEDRMRGCRTYADQALAYPRRGVVMRGRYFPADEIPAELINGQSALAMAVAEGVDLLPTTNPGVAGIKREKVGPLETEFFGPSVSSQPKLTAAMAILRPLLNGGGFSLKVDRA